MFEIGTLPTRSTIAQRPSRCATSENSSPANSPPPEATPHQKPQQHPIAQPLDRCRVGDGEEPAGLLEGEPVAAPDARAAVEGSTDAKSPERMVHPRRPARRHLKATGVRPAQKLPFELGGVH